MQRPLFRLVLLIGVTILLLVAGVASARERGGGAHPMALRGGQRQFAPARQESPPRQEAPRAPEGQIPGRAQPAPSGPNREEFAGGSPQQRAGRLTPDERKALRRQIDEARDVYRPYNAPRP